MTIEKELKALGRFAEIEKLEEALYLPGKYSPEPVVGLIPSFILGSDGPTLGRLLLVTEHLLCDVRLNEPMATFDFVDLNSILNYRFSIWTHAIKDGEEIKASYDIATIVLVHGGMAQSFHTQVEYAGNEREPWIENVLKHIPVAKVLKSGG